MLLGHSTFSETTFVNPRLDAIHNVTFGVTQDELAFTIGTETVTAGSNLTLTGTNLQFVVSLGDETTLGESFQNLISFSTGSVNFFLWNEVDDSANATWKNVDPGSTD
jgi:hypothetical protein